MELRYLRYFVAVAEELHFGRAAEKLFIAQPPLSQQIGQLEREIGVKLFERTSRRVRLTPAGEVFLRDARQILGSVEDAVQSAKRAARGETGWLGIGFAASATYDLLPAVLHDFREQFPDVLLSLAELNAAEQAAALHDRGIHVGFARPFAENTEFAVSAVLQETFLVALPETHPLASRKDFLLADLAAEAFVSFPELPRPSYAETVRLVCEAAGFTPRVVQEVREMQTAISLVTAGIGIALLPASVHHLHWTGLVLRPLREHAPRTELSVISRREHPSPTLQNFLHIVRRKLCGGRSLPHPAHKFATFSFPKEKGKKPTLASFSSFFLTLSFMPAALLRIRRRGSFAQLRQRRSRRGEVSPPVDIIPCLCHTLPMISSASPPPVPTLPLTVRELSSATDHAAWNRFVGIIPEGDVLQTWEWGAVKRADWTAIRLGQFRGDELVGGTQLLRRKIPLVGNFFYAPRGPLLADWTDEAALTTLLDAIRIRAKDDGAAFLTIDPAVSIERTDVTALLTRHGFAPPATADVQGFGGIQPRCVMQLDLAGRTEADLLASFKPQTRRNIKLAFEKHGVEMVESPTRADLAVFNELMQITGTRNGFRPRPLSYFETLWDTLVPAGLAKLFLTRYQGQILSGALCFTIGDKAWYVYGDSSNEHRNVMPTYAMQWSMIRWAREMGCAWYDFRGVSPRRRQEGEAASDVEKEDHLQGLNRFKEGFGTRYVEYVGEFDLIYNKAAYWTYTKGKPAAQKIARKLKGR